MCFSINVSLSLLTVDAEKSTTLPQKQILFSIFVMYSLARISMCVSMGWCVCVCVYISWYVVFYLGRTRDDNSSYTFILILFVLLLSFRFIPFSYFMLTGLPFFPCLFVFHICAFAKFIQLCELTSSFFFCIANEKKTDCIERELTKSSRTIWCAMNIESN